MFRGCSAATPCLQKDGTCSAETPQTQCSRCTIFGAGGGANTVCPDGQIYLEAKTKCLSLPGAVFEPINCQCNRYASPTCPDGTLYERAKASCQPPSVFVPDTCKCINNTASSLNCPDGGLMADSKAACLVGPNGPLSNSWDPLTCICSPIPDRCVELALKCRSASTAATPMVFVPATPTTDCACVQESGVKPAEPTVFQFSVKLTFRNMTLAQLKELYVRMSIELGSKLSATFPSSSFSVDGVSEDQQAQTVVLSLVVMSFDKEEGPLIVDLIKSFVASTDFQAAYLTSGASVEVSENSGGSVVPDANAASQALVSAAVLGLGLAVAFSL